MAESEQTPLQDFFLIPSLPSSAIAIIIAVGASVLYVGTVWFDFVYDDVYTVIDSPSIRSWHYLGSYLTTPLRGIPYYRPVHLIWFRLNYAMFGQRPAGWHAACVLLNAIAVVMIYRLASKLVGGTIAPAAAATLFAVHPVHIENVAWISSACDPLMAIFFCSALLCYLNSREGLHRTAWTASSLVCFVLALLSKEPAVALPLVIALHAFLYDDGALRHKVLTSLRCTIPFIALLSVYFWIRHLALPTLAPVLTKMSWRTLLLTQPSLLWFYLSHLFWPLHLSVFPGLQPVQVPSLFNFFLPSMLVLGVITTIFLWCRASREHSRTIILFTFWFFVTLLPVFYIRSFAPTETVHDRYLYLPSTGFAILVALALQQLLLDEILQSKRKLILSAAAVAVLAFCILNLTQQTVWANDLSLYSNGVAVNPSNIVALNGLARILTDRGDYATAAPMFEEILRQHPDAWMADYNLGFIDYRVGRYPEAEFHLRRAIAGYDNDSFFHLYLGLTYLDEGKLDEAESEICRAIAIRGDRPGQHLALSILLEKKGDHINALNEARKEVSVAPTPTALQRVATLQNQP
jgi:protein O-mannosyl-transferase